MSVMRLWEVLWNYRSTLVLVLLPLLSMPLPIVFRNSEASCGFCIIVMSGYWISECLPLAVTAFLPLILFPLMGILKASEVSVVYFKDTNWLIVGGLILAVGVEHTNLHRRIALSVLLLLGTSPQSLMLGFMLPTYFMSMWISNVAATAMMIPVVNAVLMELREKENDLKEIQEKESDEEIEMQVPETTTFSNQHAGEFVDDEKQLDLDAHGGHEETSCDDFSVREQEGEERQVLDEITLVEKGLTICVPYASTVGGIATLTGTPPNLVLAGQYRILYPDAVPQISFGNWIAYHLPISLLLLGFTYMWLLWLYIGMKCNCGRTKTEMDHRVRNVLKSQYRELGKIRWNELTVVIVLTSTVLLWFFRDPGFMPGWSVIFQDGFVSDGTVAMTMATLLFILPNDKPAFLRKRPIDPEAFRPLPSVVDWKTVSRAMPWSIVFLIGGAYALAEGATKSGFTDWFANQLIGLEGIPPWVVCLVVTVIACLFTECISNVAVASIFIPIVSKLAQVLEVHPLYFLLPTVVATSLAFMLPVATPPNAVAFSYGYLKVLDLVKSGWFLNVFGVIILMVFVNSYANVIYQVNQFPEWAALNYTSG